MMLSRVDMNLAKNVYQLNAADHHGRTIWKRRFRHIHWRQMLPDMAEPGCDIGMEACTDAPATLDDKDVCDLEDDDD